MNLLQHCFIFMSFFFGHEECGILAPQPGFKFPPPFLECSLNHWTAKEALEIILGVSQKSYEKHVCVLSCSVMSDFATIWTVACQAPLSMGFSRQEYWSVLPFPPPEGLLDLRIKGLSRRPRGERPLVELYLEPGGVFRTTHGRVTAPSC